MLALPFARAFAASVASNSEEEIGISRRISSPLPAPVRRSTLSWRRIRESPWGGGPTGFQPLGGGRARARARVRVRGRDRSSISLRDFVFEHTFGVCPRGRTTPSFAGVFVRFPVRAAAMEALVEA
jgi:hypothetical protein